MKVILINDELYSQFAGVNVDKLVESLLKKYLDSNKPIKPWDE